MAETTHLSCKVCEGIQVRKYKSSDFITDDEREESGEYVIPVGPTEDMR